MIISTDTAEEFDSRRHSDNTKFRTLSSPSHEKTWQHFQNSLNTWMIKLKRSANCAIFLRRRILQLSALGSKVLRCGSSLRLCLLSAAELEYLAFNLADASEVVALDCTPV